MAEHVKSIWKTIAFLGRYGHQDAKSCLELPYTDLIALAAEVGNLVREEGDAMKTGLSHD